MSIPPLNLQMLVIEIATVFCVQTRKSECDCHQRFSDQQHLLIMMIDNQIVFEDYCQAITFVNFIISRERNLLGSDGRQICAAGIPQPAVLSNPAISSQHLSDICNKGINILVIVAHL